MAKKKGLHITKQDLFVFIQEFTGNEEWLVEEKLINPVNKCYRYQIKCEEDSFYADVFYRIDNTITVKPYEANGDGEKSKKLCKYVEDSAPFKDAPHGEFSVILSQENMNLLVEYLKTVSGVSLHDEFDNGTNGKGYTFISDIGDKITLTYYSTTSRMMFQGMMLQLSSEVKCFIAPLGNIYDKKCYAGAVAGVVQSVIEKAMPNSYSNLDVLQQDLIHDSVAQMVCKPVTRDYSVWAFSILKGLESRIKEIFAHESITVYDNKGFSVYDRSQRKNRAMFIKDSARKYILDTSIVPITDGNTFSVLSDLYDYFNKNRNCLFHTKQAGATKVLETDAEAIIIISDVMKLIENSYNVLGY